MKDTGPRDVFTESLTTSSLELPTGLSRNLEYI